MSVSARTNLMDQGSGRTQGSGAATDYAGQATSGGAGRGINTALLLTISTRKK
jgi:hypothetical protein